MKKFQKILPASLAVLLIFLMFSVTANAAIYYTDVSFAVSPGTDRYTTGTTNDYIRQKTDSSQAYVYLRSSASVGAKFRVYGANNFSSVTESMGGTTNRTATALVLTNGKGGYITNSVYGNNLYAVIAAANNGYSVTYGVTAYWTPNT